jgi:hypothetical protein
MTLPVEHIIYMLCNCSAVAPVHCAFYCECIVHSTAVSALCILLLLCIVHATVSAHVRSHAARVAVCAFQRTAGTHRLLPHLVWTGLVPWAVCVLHECCQQSSSYVCRNGLIWLCVECSVSCERRLLPFSWEGSAVAFVIALCVSELQCFL